MFAVKRHIHYLLITNPIGSFDPVFHSKPLLNVRATHKITRITSTTTPSDTGNTIPSISQTEDIIIGVNVRGKLSNPKLTLYSDPADLSQSDILSYLILGRPTSKISKADGRLLFKALTILNFGGSDSEQIGAQLQHNLGLDELSIETEETLSADSDGGVVENTSLILGKALSPKLYLQYSLDIIELVNTLRVRYLIDKSWLLQTQTNTIGTNSLDVLYTFEHR